jgi:hypothetical protein
MSNPTTPFGWQMPENTDLVTDLPADFEVFGQAVATDLQYLLGGTTGQVLAKASATDLDFVWSADAAGMTNPMTTTGDSIYSSSGSTPARLGIGSAGQVLTVASGLPSWATPSAGISSPNFTLLNASGTALSGSSTVTVTFTAQDYLFVRVENASNASASTQFNMRFNSNTGTNYYNSRLIFQGGSGGVFVPINVFSTTDTSFRIAGMGNISSTANSFSYISGAKTSGIKTYLGFSSVDPTAFDDSMSTSGFFSDSATITTVSIISTNGNFNGGTIYVYGA